MELTQYKLILINSDPTHGIKIKNTRTCVIILPNEMLKKEELKTF